MKVLRDHFDKDGKYSYTEDIFNIMQGTYSGTYMGERSISAHVEFPAPIDLKIGDYVEYENNTLTRGINNDVSFMERFYLYNEVSIKKIARKLTVGNAFQSDLVFYPRQYELSHTKFRDLYEDKARGLVYTGSKQVNFYGGAKQVMDRIMAVLRERYGDTGVPGVDYWDYMIADEVNEYKNTACENFQFDISDATVMDVLNMLTNDDGVNTHFWINERMIFVGFRNPHISGVDKFNQIQDFPFQFAYGKTSHLPIETPHGNLFTIQKAVEDSSPITRLYADGSNRNLHRFYCSDRIKSGRYIERLMLPSFSDDGRTDYIDADASKIAKYGIREGFHTFDGIYPSLRYITMGDIREVRYCIKLMGSGLEDTYHKPEKNTIYLSELNQKMREDLNLTGRITKNGKDVYLGPADAKELYDNGVVTTVVDKVSKRKYEYPIARIQCYKVEPIIKNGKNTGLNKLVECAPPEDLAVFVHASGKVVKCILYAAKDGKTAEERQAEHDEKLPVDDNGNVIVGSCFAIDCGLYEPTTYTPNKYIGSIGRKMQDIGGNLLTRADWFVNPDDIPIYDDPSDKNTNPKRVLYKNEVSINQINYTDTAWITDIFEFESATQEHFQRHGYSAYCWPRVNSFYYSSQDNKTPVHKMIDVTPVMLADTDLSLNENKSQATFDIFIRDIGFRINEQNWFGDYVFVFDTVKVSFLDGNLGGYEFEIPAETDSNSISETFIPAYLEDGSENPAFFNKGFEEKARNAVAKGAYWRVELKRASTNIENVYVPNVNLNASAGDAFVLLDITMPDVYQRAAERKLEREAMRYLEANDKAHVQYGFEFDKVRMLNTPLFGIQMREGAMMRIVDDDLEIRTDADTKVIVDYRNAPAVYTTSLVKDNSHVVIVNHEVYRDPEYIYATCEYPAYSEMPRINAATPRHFDIVLTMSEMDENKELCFIKEGLNNLLRIQHAKFENGKYIPWEGQGWTDLYVDGVSEYKESGKLIKNKRILHVHVNSRYTGQQHYGYIRYGVIEKESKIVNEAMITPSGDVYCQIPELTTFIADKSYELIIDIPKDGSTIFDADGRPVFFLADSMGEHVNWYTPKDYKAVVIDNDPKDKDYNINPFERNKWTRYRITFSFDETFNDSVDYYPTLMCKADGVSEGYSCRLKAIRQYNNAELKDLNYVDLVIDTVSIEFHDNTREPDVCLQNGLEPGRLTKDPQVAMSRQIAATVKQNMNAQGWGAVMNKLDRADVQSEMNAQAYQTIVNMARENYTRLLGLKNSIFDPDGTCNDTFLQLMMLQVGADSMNYKLRYTGLSVDGKTCRNFAVVRSSNPDIKPDSLVFYGTDELEHYVYTQDEPSGKWFITEPNMQQSGQLCSFALEKDADGNWPVYYVSIKCNIHDSREAEWVCGTEQIQVNAEDGYYHFNWGILTPDEEGHYTPMETRGCAYMYGDNIVCGTISSLAKNSYFDLTNGNFVLGKGEGGAMLSFQNGVLTINNTFTSTTIDGGAILTDLLLLKDGEDEDAGVTAGVSGKTGELGQGVSMWAGGNYETALEASEKALQELVPLLPLLLTKTGIGSNIGCLKVTDENSICILSKDGKKRIIINADTGGDVTISMDEKLKNDSWKTKTMLTTGIVTPPTNTSIEIDTMMSNKTDNWPIAKGEDIAVTEPLIARSELTTGSSVNCIVNLGKADKFFTCDISGSHTICMAISPEIFSSFLITHVNKKYVMDCEIGFHDGTNWVEFVTTSVEGSLETRDSHRYIRFNIPFFSTKSLYRGGTNISLRLFPTKFHYYHGNKQSFSQHVSYYNPDVMSNSIALWFEGQDINFVEYSPLDVTVYGSNGMLMANTTSSYIFMSRYGKSSANIDIRMAGLPTSESDAYTHGIYVDSNGNLKIN